MDFRSFHALLEERGDVLRIDREVDPRYELSALLDQAEKRGKAIVFENVKGAAYPAAGANLLNRRRQALGLGRDEHSLDDRDGYRHLFDDAWANPIPAETVSDAPVHEVVLTGDEIDLTKLPVPTFFSGDTHPFITAGLGLAADPDTGFENLGFYRTPIVDAKTLSVGASQISNLRRIYNKAMEQGSSMPIALVVGAPPSFYLTAASQVRPGLADVDVAGALQQSPVEMVKCQTNDLLVPARAEFVIEAEVDFSQDVAHVMGEYGDNYGDNTSPIARVTAITHRTDPYFQIINAGMTPEHNKLGRILFSHLRYDLEQHLREQFDFIADVHMDNYPPHGGARSRCAVAITKTDDGQPQQVIDAIYDFTAGRFPMKLVLQRVVVVDDDVDVTNLHDVQWAIGTRLSGEDRIKVHEAGGIVREGQSMRVCIDATVPVARRDSSARPIVPDAEQYPLDNYL